MRFCSCSKDSPAYYNDPVGILLFCKIIDNGNRNHKVTMENNCSSANCSQFDSQLYSPNECARIMELHKMAWIELNLGQQVKSLSKQIFIGILYSMILCTGVFGNIATCIVIARKRYMHTRTNCYLFSLAVSDLLLLVCGKSRFNIKALINLWLLFNTHIHMRK